MTEFTDTMNIRKKKYICITNNFKRQLRWWLYQNFIYVTSEIYTYITWMFLSTFLSISCYTSNNFLLNRNPSTIFHKILDILLRLHVKNDCLGNVNVSSVQCASIRLYKTSAQFSIKFSNQSVNRYERVFSHHDRNVAGNQRRNGKKKILSN